ncbi:MAG: hypothetical protein M1482_17665 [Chloroflexi bacterium]|nr:hypothetical protein [Chloroflexota bacterium]
MTLFSTQESSSVAKHAGSARRRSRFVSPLMVVSIRKAYQRVAPRVDSRPDKPGAPAERGLTAELVPAVVTLRDDD